MLKLPLFNIMGVPTPTWSRIPPVHCQSCPLCEVDLRCGTYQREAVSQSLPYCKYYNRSDVSLKLPGMAQPVFS